MPFEKDKYTVVDGNIEFNDEKDNFIYEILLIIDSLLLSKYMTVPHPDPSITFTRIIPEISDYIEGFINIGSKIRDRYKFISY